MALMKGIIPALLLLASPALAQAPPPIPPIADVNRVQTYNISSSTPQVAVGFPVFGDCTDLTVTIAGVIQPLSSGLWNCASASGFALNTLPLPITDMVVNFTPALTSGALVIQGAWHPRNLTVPTAPGISRREYEQAVSTLIAAQRELYYQYGTLFAAGVTPIGPQLDAQFGSAQGDIFFRGANNWTVLTPGVSGQVLQTGGPGADASWRTVSGVGTVTSVATGTGLTGGPITAGGTISLANAANGTVKSNISGGSAAPIDNTQTAVFDSVFGSAQGNILYRGASTWGVLAPGTAGQFLKTGGAAANPSWVTSTVNAPTSIALGGVFSSTAPGGQVATGVDTSGNVTYGVAPYASISPGQVVSNITGGAASPIGNSLSSVIDSVFGNAQGDILYRTNTGWAVLVPGTNGQVLTTAGASANPTWTTVSGTGTVTSVATGTGLTGGTITGAGTLSLATAANNTIKSNISGGTAAPTDNSLSAILDGVIGNTQGSVIIRGPATWIVLGPGSAGQALITNGGGQNPSWLSGAASLSTPADPTGTTNTTGVMMGLAGSVTPLRNGKVIFIVNGGVLNNTNGNGCSTELRYGTGSAPANAAAPVGTVVGNPVPSTAAINGAYPFSNAGVVTGLSVGTAYWFDLKMKAVTGGTCSISSITMTAMEQ